MAFYRSRVKEKKMACVDSHASLQDSRRGAVAKAIPETRVKLSSCFSCQHAFRNVLNITWRTIKFEIFKMFPFHLWWKSSVTKNVFNFSRTFFFCLNTGYTECFCLQALSCLDNNLQTFCTYICSFVPFIRKVLG